MKQFRRFRSSGYQPLPPPSLAVFRCRRCLRPVTKPLQLLTDINKLNRKEKQSLVPPGRYWPVETEQEFEGLIAVSTDDITDVVGLHSDFRRLQGCCGPNGTFGANRVCLCGREIGTERSDCIWPYAVYLDPTKVVGVAPEAESETTASAEQA